MIRYTEYDQNVLHNVRELIMVIVTIALTSMVVHKLRGPISIGYTLQVDNGKTQQTKATAPEQRLCAMSAIVDYLIWRRCLPRKKKHTQKKLEI